jgi:hypothetical protein
LLKGLTELLNTISSKPKNEVTNQFTKYVQQ